MQQAAGSLAGFFGSVVPAELVDVPSIALDRSLRRYLGRHGLQSALLGYRGYPAHCSVSPNDVAVHGIPSARRFCRGDVFTVDIAAAGGGWLTDSAWTFLMPGASRRSGEEYRAAWDAFQALVAAIEPGLTLEDVASIAEDTASDHGLATVPEFTGHGIGRQLHEAPVVPFARSAVAKSSRAREIRLLPGMVFNVEPVYRSVEGAGSGVVLDGNGWAYRTGDGARTYHFELTIAMVEPEPMVLQLGEPVSRALRWRDPRDVLRVRPD